MKPRGWRQQSATAVTGSGEARSTEHLRAVTGRTVTFTTRVSHGPSATGSEADVREVYVLGHEELQTTALTVLGPKQAFRLPGTAAHVGRDIPGPGVPAGNPGIPAPTPAGRRCGSEWPPCRGPVGASVRARQGGCPIARRLRVRGQETPFPYVAGGDHQGGKCSQGDQLCQAVRHAQTAAESVDELPGAHGHHADEGGHTWSGECRGEGGPSDSKGPRWMALGNMRSTRLISATTASGTATNLRPHRRLIRRSHLARQYPIDPGYLGFVLMGQPSGTGRRIG